MFSCLPLALNLLTELFSLLTISLSGVSFLRSGPRLSRQCCFLTHDPNTPQGMSDWGGLEGREVALHHRNKELNLNFRHLSFYFFDVSW